MIPSALYSLLTSNSDITDIVGTKIYPEIAPQNVEMPFIVYQIDSVTPTTSKDSASKLDVYSVTIVSSGNDYDDLFDLSGKIRETLDRYSGTIASTEIDQINFLGLDSGYDNAANVFVINSNYQIRVKL